MIQKGEYEYIQVSWLDTGRRRPIKPDAPQRRPPTNDGRTTLKASSTRAEHRKKNAGRS